MLICRLLVELYYHICALTTVLIAQTWQRSAHRSCSYQCMVQKLAPSWKEWHRYIRHICRFLHLCLRNCQIIWRYIWSGVRFCFTQGSGASVCQLVCLSVCLSVTKISRYLFIETRCISLSLKFLSIYLSGDQVHLSVCLSLKYLFIETRCISLSVT